mmetsp:Transcript_32975/g.60033  ORF Transcript_32975/g.60033 Transcript_32975/m.60033 type:complete len:202 (+) Transcript_32975:763-1368(+)
MAFFVSASSKAMLSFISSSERAIIWARSCILSSSKASACWIIAVLSLLICETLSITWTGSGGLFLPQSSRIRAFSDAMRPSQSRTARCRSGMDSFSYSRRKFSTSECSSNCCFMISEWILSHASKFRLPPRCSEAKGQSPIKKLLQTVSSLNFSFDFVLSILTSRPGPMRASSIARALFIFTCCNTSCTQQLQARQKLHDQ